MNYKPRMLYYFVHNLGVNFDDVYLNWPSGLPFPETSQTMDLCVSTARGNFFLGIRFEFSTGISEKQILLLNMYLEEHRLRKTDRVIQAYRRTVHDLSSFKKPKLDIWV